MADPQVVTQYQTTIPEYARRYVEDLLGVGAGTVYQYKKDAQGNIVTDEKGMPVISGFQPYMQYTGERFAQFTPLQRQAMEAAGQLRVPGQMYDASQIAKLAAERAGGTTYTPYNYQAAQVSVDPSRYITPQMRAAQTAQQFGQQRFTAPGVAQSYMSPYLQNVVDIEKREAQRQADIARTGRGAQFAKAGAFGGARQAIEEAEARRNLATQMGDIQARGLQSAYDRAGQMFATDEARAAQYGIQSALANLSNEQQAAVQNQAAQLQTQGLSTSQALQAALANQQAYQQAANLSEQSRQYGAGLGLQGLQAAMTGAGQLGNLGQNIYGQYTGNIDIQNRLGGQQQQQMQNMLTANYQDFLNAQNQPYKQLGFMSDLLRGTQGLGQSNIYQYQQPPSMIGQLAGLGTAAAGFGKLFAEGGSVTSDEAVEGYLDDLSDQQLAQARQVAMAKQDMARIQLIEQELAQRASLRRGMGSAFNALPQQTQQRVVSAAEGGVMRFSDGGMDPSGISPEFGGTVGTYVTPEKRSMDEVSRMAEEMRAKGKSVGLSDIQDMIDRRGQYKESLPTAPTPAPARPAPVAEKPKADLSRTERKALSSVATAVASNTGADRGGLMSSYESLFAKRDAANKEDMKGIMDAIKQLNKLPEYDRNDAMVKFGLAMAQAASRPGASLLSSLAEGAPAIVAHREAYDKRADEAKRLNAQLNIEYRKLAMAQRNKDSDAAMDASLKIQQLKQHERQIAQQGAYQQAALAQRGEQFNQMMGIRQKQAEAQGLTAQAAMARVQAQANKEWEAGPGPRLERQLAQQYGKNWASQPESSAMYQQRKNEFIRGAAASTSTGATPLGGLLSNEEMMKILGPQE